MVDRSTPWEVKQNSAIQEAYCVTRIDKFGRRVSIYDNWFSLTEREATAIRDVLNALSL